MTAGVDRSLPAELLRVGDSTTAKLWVTAHWPAAGSTLQGGQIAGGIAYDYWHGDDGRAYLEILDQEQP